MHLNWASIFVPFSLRAVAAVPQNSGRFQCPPDSALPAFTPNEWDSSTKICSREIFCRVFDRSVCIEEVGQSLYKKPRAKEVRVVLEEAAKLELDQWQVTQKDMTVYCQIIMEAGLECFGCDNAAFEDFMYRNFPWKGVKDIHTQKYAHICAANTSTTLELVTTEASTASSSTPIIAGGGSTPVKRDRSKKTSSSREIAGGGSTPATTPLNSQETVIIGGGSTQATTTPLSSTEIFVGEGSDTTKTTATTTAVTTTATTTAVTTTAVTTTGTKAVTTTTVTSSSQETIVVGGGSTQATTTPLSSQETVVAGGDGSNQTTTTIAAATVATTRATTTTTAKITATSSSQETAVASRGSTRATTTSSPQKIVASRGSNLTTATTSSSRETVFTDEASTQAPAPSISQEAVDGAGSTPAIAASSSQDTTVVGEGSTQTTTTSSSQETVAAGRATSESTSSSSVQMTFASEGSTPAIAALSSQETVVAGRDMFIIVGIIVAIAILVIVAIVGLVILLRSRSVQIPTPKPQRKSSAPVVTPLSDAFLIPFEQIEIGQVIAAGGQGQIHKGTFVGKNVAIKQLMQAMFDPKDIEQLEVEARMLCSLHHPNIVRFYGLCIDNSQMRGRSYYLVSDIKDTDLKKYMENNSQPNASEILRIAMEVCSALEFLHSRLNPMVHRDLKPGNILLDAKRTAFLCDFGLTAVYTDGTNVDMTLNKGTAAYMAPELSGLTNYAKTFGTMEDSGIAESDHATEILVQKHAMENNPAYNTLATSDQRSFQDLSASGAQPAGRKTSRFQTTAAEACKVDCYAYALVLWGLLSWKLPFRNISDIKIIVAVAFNRQRPSTQDIVKLRWNPKVIYLMRKMWDQDPSARPTMTECRNELEIISQNPQADPEDDEFQDDYGEDVQKHFGEFPEGAENGSDAGRNDADNQSKIHGGASVDMGRELNNYPTSSVSPSVSKPSGDDGEGPKNDYAIAPEFQKDSYPAESKLSRNMDNQLKKTAVASAYAANQPSNNGAINGDYDKQVNAGATTSDNPKANEFPEDYYQELGDDANALVLQKGDDLADICANIVRLKKSSGSTFQPNVSVASESTSFSEPLDGYDPGDDYDNTPDDNAAEN